MPTFGKTNRISSILVVLCILMKESSEHECGPYMEHIVSGPKGVSDENISASSMFPNSQKLHDPKYGRLYHYLSAAEGSSSAWCAHVFDTSHYIQVAFNNPMIVCAVLTQGRANILQWITSFAVLHSLDRVSWRIVNNVENNMIFNGNTDKNTVVRNNFKECVVANYIRINPKTWNEPMCLRMDFLGCSKARKNFLMLKNTRKTKFWKRTSVYKENRHHLSEHWTPHLGSCAIACHQMSHCVDYEFNPQDNKCVLLTGGKSQNDNNAAAGSNVYSRNIDYLARSNDYEIKTNGTSHTYYKIITEKKTKTEASQVCAEDDARLLVIDSSEIMTFIQEDIKKSLILAQETDFYVNGEYKEGKWAFETNTEVPSNLWASSFPVNNNGNCIVVTATGLKTKNCQSPLYFVCEMFN